MPKTTGVDIQGSAFHPFNSQKVLVHGKRMEAIVNECYLPPVVLNLDVTGRCQYRCGHCHHRSKQIRDQHLPDLPERLARTLPHFLKRWNVDGYGVEACCIVGSQGDPLVYPHLPELLRGLHAAGIEVGLVSNGYGLDDRLMYHSAFYTKFVGFSMDAGTEQGYNRVKRPPDGAWDRVLGNIGALTTTLAQQGIRNDVGWKILVLPETQNEIFESCRLAKELGCRYVQIRPADLPEVGRSQIDVDLVAAQIRRAIVDLEVPGTFEVVGIRHKFTPEFSRILPEYCWLTPLTATVTSDGKVYACVDRRCDKQTLLCHCGEWGWRALSQEWGSVYHVGVVDKVINRCGAGPDCKIRCSNYGYDKFFQNYFVSDHVDWKLI